MSFEDDTTRRTLLKTLGTASLAFGAVGVGSARDAPTEELTHVETAYGSPTRARWAAAQHADPVLTELARRGVLERGDVTELDFEGVETKGLFKNDEVVVQLATETEFEGYTVEFVARPQTGRVYATVRPDDGDTYTVESAADSDDVTTQDCWYEHDCTNLACGSGGSGCAYLERECCNPCLQESSDELGTSDCETTCSDWSADGCCLC